MRRPDLPVLVQRLWLAALSLLLGGCLGETITQRNISIQPDGTGAVRFVTSLFSTNETEVAEALAQISSGEPDEELSDLGFRDVVAVVLENHGSNALLATTARFEDWATLARWIFDPVQNFDPEHSVVVRQEAGHLFVDAFVPGLCESNETDCASMEGSLFLTVELGDALLLESNADSYDEYTHELSWSVKTIVTDGIRFNVQLTSDLTSAIN